MLDVLLNHPEKKSRKKGLLKVSERADKPIKSFIKSISWRIVGTMDTILISFFITGKLSMAFSIGSIEVITKTILYYFHERLWAHIHKIKLNLTIKSNVKRYEVERTEQSAYRKIS